MALASIPRTLKRYGATLAHPRPGAQLLEAMRKCPKGAPLYLPAQSQATVLLLRLHDLLEAGERGGLGNGELLERAAGWFARLSTLIPPELEKLLRGYCLELIWRLALSENGAPWLALLQGFLRRKTPSLSYDAASLLAGYRFHIQTPDAYLPLLATMQGYSPRRRAVVLGYLAGMLPSEHWDFYALCFDHLAGGLPAAVRADQTAYFAWRGVHAGERRQEAALAWTGSLAGEGSEKTLLRWYVWEGLAQPPPTSAEGLEGGLDLPLSTGADWGFSFALALDFSKIYSLPDLARMVMEEEAGSDIFQRASEAIVKLMNSKELSDGECFALLPLLQSVYGPKIAPQLENPSAYYRRYLKLVSYQPQVLRMLQDAALLDACATLAGGEAPLPRYEHEPQTFAVPSSLEVWRIPYSWLTGSRLNYYKYFTKYQ